MARSFTVVQLITRAKQRSDMENDSMISETEWKSMLSTIYGEFYGVLVESGMRYFESEQTISTDGSSSYALPAAFLSTVGVDYLADANGERRALREMMAQERNRYSGISGSEAYEYAIVGSNIRLYPTPASGQTYYHVYVPQPTDLSGASDSDSVDVVTPDGEAFITWGLTVLALAKQETDTSLARAEREAARERLYQWATLRSLHTPRRNVVEGDFDYRDPGDWWR